MLVSLLDPWRELPRGRCSLQPECGQTEGVTVPAVSPAGERADVGRTGKDENPSPAGTPKCGGVVQAPGSESIEYVPSSHSRQLFTPAGEGGVNGVTTGGDPKTHL